MLMEGLDEEGKMDAAASMAAAAAAAAGGDGGGDQETTLLPPPPPFLGLPSAEEAPPLLPPDAPSFSLDGLGDILAGLGGGGGGGGGGKGLNVSLDLGLGGEHLGGGGVTVEEIGPTGVGGGLGGLGDLLSGLGGGGEGSAKEEDIDAADVGGGFHDLLAGLGGDNGGGGDDFDLGSLGNLGHLFGDNDTGDGISKVLREFEDAFKHEERATPSVFVTLTLLYTFFILLGVSGNLIILTAIMSKTKMRTARNIFIVTLSSSDLVLCLVAMPLTLWDVLSQKWPFGKDLEWLCKLAQTGQGIPVYMSSMAIAAIALDRFRCIMQPDRPHFSAARSIAASFVMAAVSVALSIPVFRTAKVRNYVEFPDQVSLVDIYICESTWEADGKMVYTVISIIAQFFLPVIIVGILYCSIYLRLKNRPQSQHPENNLRRRRANHLIVAIAVIFFLSWLPLNVYTGLMELAPQLIRPHIRGYESPIYAVMHLFGLSNACVNPILYGYLNENFRKEYRSIYRKMPWYTSTTNHQVAIHMKIVSGNFNNNLSYHRRDSAAAAAAALSCALGGSEAASPFGEEEDEEGGGEGEGAPMLVPNGDAAGAGGIAESNGKGALPCLADSFSPPPPIPGSPPPMLPVPATAAAATTAATKTADSVSKKMVRAPSLASYLFGGGRGKKVSKEEEGKKAAAAERVEPCIVMTSEAPMIEPTMAREALARAARERRPSCGSGGLVPEEEDGEFGGCGSEEEAVLRRLGLARRMTLPGLGPVRVETGQLRHGRCGKGKATTTSVLERGTPSHLKEGGSEDERRARLGGLLSVQDLHVVLVSTKGTGPLRKTMRRKVKEQEEATAAAVAADRRRTRSRRKSLSPLGNGMMSSPGPVITEEDEEEEERGNGKGDGVFKKATILCKKKEGTFRSSRASSSMMRRTQSVHAGATTRVTSTSNGCAGGVTAQQQMRQQQWQRQRKFSLGSSSNVSRGSPAAASTVAAAAASRLRQGPEVRILSVGDCRSNKGSGAGGDAAASRRRTFGGKRKLSLQQFPIPDLISYAASRARAKARPRRSNTSAAEGGEGGASDKFKFVPWSVHEDVEEVEEEEEEEGKRDGRTEDRKWTEDEHAQALSPPATPAAACARPSSRRHNKVQTAVVRRPMNLEGLQETPV